VSDLKNFLFHFSIEIDDDKLLKELLENGEVVLILTQVDKERLLVTVERTGEVVGEGRVGIASNGGR
jgi:hypothetical protein